MGEEFSHTHFLCFRFPITGFATEFNVHWCFHILFNQGLYTFEVKN